MKKKKSIGTDDYKILLPWAEKIRKTAQRYPDNPGAVVKILLDYAEEQEIALAKRWIEDSKAREEIRKNTCKSD